MPLDTSWLPRQLRDPRIHFIRLRPLEKSTETKPPFPYKKGSGKLPADKGWPTKKYYYYDEKKIHEWHGEGNNVGVICRNGLIGIDLDEIDRLKELGKISVLPPTFSDRTGGGGIHYWYWCPFLQRKIVFHDPKLTESDKKDPNKTRPKHLGEIQQGNHFVAAPGSLHHTGNYYEIVDDLPIATIEESVIDAFLEGLIVNQQIWDASDPMRFEKSKTRRSVERINSSAKQVRKDGKNLASLVNIPIEDIVFPHDLTKDDGNVAVGSNPWHGSDSGQNFSITRSDGLWHCWRDGTGGTWVEALAVELGVLSCEECEPGCLRGIKFVQFFAVAKEWAEEHGYNFPEFDEIFDKKQDHTTDIKLIDDGKRITLDDLPDELPEATITLIKGLPRIGKSHWAIKQLVKAKTGAYATNKHTIVGHVAERYVQEGGKGAVWFEGKARSCRKMNDKNGIPPCENCPMRPDEQDEEHVGFFENREVAKMLYNEKRSKGVITKDDVPDEYCPYYVIREVVWYADKVFTVVDLLDDITSGREDADENRRSYDLFILDEDGCADSFYSHPTPILTIGGSKDNQEKHRPLGNAKATADNVRNLITAAERTSEAEKQLLTLLDEFDKIYTIASHMFEHPGEERKSQLQELSTILSPLPGKYTEDIKTAMLEYVKSHSRITSAENKLIDYLTSILYNYTNIPCGIVPSRNGASVYITGNEMMPYRPLQWAKAFHQMIFIGSTKLEQLAMSIDPQNTKVIDIPTFRYENNYAIITIRGKTVLRERAKVLDVEKMVAAHSTEEKTGLVTKRMFVDCSGSKGGQSWARKHLPDNSILVSDSNENDVKHYYRYGNIILIYANGSQSRGVDMPHINLAFGSSLGFATPFWSILMQSEDEDTRDYARDFRDALISDEAMNLMLRPAPVRGFSEDQAKVMVVAEGDAWKFGRGLGMRVINSSEGKTFSVESIASCLLTNGLCGEVQVNSKGEVESSRFKVSGDCSSAVVNGSLIGHISSQLREIELSDDKAVIQWGEIEKAISGHPMKVSEIANIAGMKERSIQRSLSEHSDIIAYRKMGRNNFYYLKKEETELGSEFDRIADELARRNRELKEEHEHQMFLALANKLRVGEVAKRDDFIFAPDDRPKIEIARDVRSGVLPKNYFKLQKGRSAYFVKGRDSTKTNALKSLVSAGIFEHTSVIVHASKSDADGVVFAAFRKIRDVDKIS